MAESAPKEANEESRLKVLPLDGKDDLTCSTFVMHGEDHTLGNAVRHIIMKDPEVEFCGYTVPHPSEHLIYLRIQSSGAAGASAADVLKRGLSRLDDTCQHILEKFDASVAYFQQQEIAKQEAMNTS